MVNNFMDDELRESIHRFNKSMESYYRRINKSTAKVTSLMEDLNKSTLNVRNRVLETTRPITSIKFPKLELSKEFKDTMEKFAESLKDSIVSIEDYKKLCLLLGYPPHEDMSIPEIRGIVSTYKDLDGDLDKIRPIIDRFYAEEVDIKFIRENLFPKWVNSELLNKRVKIIKESINCFENELYFSAIPLLFSQLEGMVADANNHSGQMGGKELGNYMIKMFSDENKYSFDDELLQFYSNVLFVGFGHSQELKSFLSRHAIMHGGDIEYGTQQNYIKLILFFDSVYERLIEKIEEENSATQY